MICLKYNQHDTDTHFSVRSMVRLLHGKSFPEVPTPTNFHLNLSKYDVLLLGIDTEVPKCEKEIV